MPTVHLMVEGKVQGVYYRAMAKEVADKLQLSGWVRNTRQGNVETVATGTQQQLQQFIDWCKHGPPQAKVTFVEVIYKDEETFDGFNVIRER
jgi:acylphosphatase